MTDHTRRGFCPSQLPAITLLLCSVWAVITLKLPDSVKPNTVKSHFHIPLISLRPLYAFVLLSGVRQCQLPPGSVSNRAEPFHKLVNWGGEQKVTQQFRPLGTEPTPNACQLCMHLQTLSQMSAQPWGTDGAIRHCSSLEYWCFIATTRISRESSWCFWDCGLRVCRGRTSCADFITALLQRCACFDLTRLVFRGADFTVLLTSE